MKRARLLPALLLLLLLPSLLGAIDAYQFPDEETARRYRDLIAELRCPQCLNTNLAGSDAMIAQDLRREVHELLIAGKSDDEILAYMYERYGDFILYRPRLTWGTAPLWLGPPLLLLIGLAAVIGVIRRRRMADVAPLSEAERLRLLQLTGQSQTGAVDGEALGQETVQGASAPAEAAQPGHPDPRDQQT